MSALDDILESYEIDTDVTKNVLPVGDLRARINTQEWARAELAALRKPWISVDERLPEEETAVLVWDGDSCAVMERTGMEFEGIKDWLMCNVGGYEVETYISAPTHWMPLPEPPK